MINFYDIAYGALVGVSAPIWLARRASREKVLRALRERMGRDVPSIPREKVVVMIHAVSLGEMNATRALIDQLLQRQPDLHIVVSTTTTTGYAQGQKLFASASNVSLIRYPLDFSSAIHRVLDAIHPAVVVLMELEIWPNFVRACAKRGIKVVLANGRLTTESFSRYRRIKPIVRAMLQRVTTFCVQDDLYAKRFVALGAPQDRVQITGTMKFDTATITDRVDGDDELANEVGLRFGHEPIWVCGSTGPGEEEIILRVYRDLLGAHTWLRLVIVPRKPERFDEVAALIRAAKFDLVRRSKPESTSLEKSHAVVLGDTMGELRKFYSLADVVFVGRTLVDLGARQHGSDMIEPAALGKPIVVGAFTHNFADAMNKLRAAKAVAEVSDGGSLRIAIDRILSGASEARAMGAKAQDVVRAEQGATARHVEVISELLQRPNV